MEREEVGVVLDGTPMAEEAPAIAITSQPVQLHTEIHEAYKGIAPDANEGSDACKL